MGQFHEVRLATTISHGSSTGPGYRNNIIEQGNAVDERVARQSIPRWSGDLKWGVKSVADLTYMQNFYIARRGVLIGWRLKDFLNFTSNPVNPGYSSGLGTRDQNVGTGDGSSVNFQLIKRYTDGVGPAILKTIFKPVVNTTLMWVNGLAKVAGVDYTVDTTSGIVTFASPPGNGLAVEASFEFDVPVRFGREIDLSIQASIDGFDNGSIPNIPVIEDMSPDVGYVGDMFYGGSNTGVVSAIDITLSPGLGRIWPIKMTAGSRFAWLPATTNLPAGQRLLTIYNDSGITFGIKDPSGTILVASFTSGSVIDGHIIIDGAGQKVWMLS